jgi:hypothetical protein
MKYLRLFNKFNRLKISLKEAITDNPIKNLSDIFDESGKMKDEVSNKIKKGLEIIEDNFNELKIIDYFVVGAAVTYQYSPESDIDTTVVIDPSTPKDSMKKIDKWIEKNLDNTIYHNERPFQFKLSFDGRQKLDKVDAAYDVEKNMWIKKPDYEKSLQMYNLKVTNAQSEENKTYGNLEKFIQPFLIKLHKSLVDNKSENEIINNMNVSFSKYGEYSKFDPNSQINKKKEGFIKKFRSSAYEREIEQGYVSKNWGKGNVIYKMFDDEGYLKVFEILKDIISSKKYEDQTLRKNLEAALSKVINDEIGYKK